MRYSLFLYPEFNPQLLPVKSQLVGTLSEVKFCRKTASTEILCGGEQLMDFITFLGCSPALESAQATFAIAIHLYDRITGMGGEAIETIRFPGCKHPLPNTSELLSNYSERKRWSCPECGQQGAIEDINWRKSAGFSNLFIEISPIFPKEAIPSDRLLELLNNTTQSRWNWFYSNSSVLLAAEL
jgi:hypothetical protein